MPNRIGLKFAEWPDADKIAWLKATASKDFFDTEARAAHWRPKSRLQAFYGYGRWLGFLAQHSPEALLLRAADRVDRASVKNFVDALAQRIAPMSVAADLNHLLLALSVIAPAGDWTWLREWQARWER